MKYLFIRNDDVCRIDKKLVEFFEITEGIKTISAVIPSRLTQECAQFLIQKGADIAQHGCYHRKDRRDDVEKGMSLMTSFFGSRWTKAYVPPFSRIDGPTVKKVDNLGFEVLSAASDSTPIAFLADAGFLNLPIQVELDFEMNKKGASLDKVKDQIARESLRCDILGLVVHLREVKDMKDLGKIISFLKDFARHSRSKIIDFRDAPRLFSLPSLSVRRKARKIIRDHFVSSGGLISGIFLDKIGGYYRAKNRRRLTSNHNRS